MSCHRVRRSITAFVDETLPLAERDGVTRHLAVCGTCATRSEELRELRRAVRSLPAVAVPPAVHTRLQVVSSRERVRRLSHLSWRALSQAWAARVKLTVDNMMRPVALPFAGGLISALLLFSVLVPTLGFRHNFRNDVPISFYTEATLDRQAPFGFLNDDVVVKLTINEQGKIVDYCLPPGESGEILNGLGNMILFTSFTPATWFGQPTSGTVWIKFRRSHIVVKG